MSKLKYRISDEKMVRDREIIKKRFGPLKIVQDSRAKSFRS
jgi:hypothetical protein